MAKQLPWGSARMQIDNMLKACQEPNHLRLQHMFSCSKRN